MKNKTVLLITLLVVFVGLIGVALTTHKKTSPLVVTGVYCQSNGIVGPNKPIQSHRSYCFVSDSSGKTYDKTQPEEYSFKIIDDEGNTLKDFAITHTKPMHVIVVRKDLAYFQHVHPTYNATTGVFSFSDLKFPAPGQYRIFADFAAQGSMMDAIGMQLTTTLSEDVMIGNAANYTPQEIGTTETSKTFDGLTVALSTGSKALVVGTDTQLSYTLTQNGKLVTDLEPYLGALGHAVVLREENLDFIHAHPLENVLDPQHGTVHFVVDFPEAGRYKIFTQFQKNGKIITTDFVVIVGVNVTNSSSQGASTNHSMSGMRAMPDGTKMSN